MYASCAVRLKVGPVMPGVAAFAEGATSRATAMVSAKITCVFHIVLFMFFDLIAALLVNVHFGHKSAEVLSVVRQMVQVGGVEIEHTAARIERGVAGVKNQIERLTATKRDRVGFVIHVVARLIPQKFGV